MFLKPDDLMEITLKPPPFPPHPAPARQPSLPPAPGALDRSVPPIGGPAYRGPWTHFWQGAQVVFQQA